MVVPPTALLTAALKENEGPAFISNIAVRAALSWWRWVCLINSRLDGMMGLTTAAPDWRSGPVSLKLIAIMCAEQYPAERQEERLWSYHSEPLLPDLKPVRKHQRHGLKGSQPKLLYFVKITKGKDQQRTFCKQTLFTHRNQPKMAPVLSDCPLMCRSRRTCSKRLAVFVCRWDGRQFQRCLAFERKLRETEMWSRHPWTDTSLAPFLVIKLMDCHKRQRWSKNSHKYAFHYT